MSSAYICPCSDTFSIHLFMFSLAKVTQNVTILTRLAIFHVLYASVSYLDILKFIMIVTRLDKSAETSRVKSH